MQERRGKLRNTNSYLFRRSTIRKMSQRPLSCPICGKDLDTDESLYNVGYGPSYNLKDGYNKNHKKKACGNCFDDRYKE